jgi:hypothetical protein
MNIKTTIVLLILLAGVGSYVFFTRDKSDTPAKPVVHTLLDVKADDVTRFVITNSDGKKIAGQKTAEGSAPATWKLTDPIAAPAESYKITSLLESLTGLKSNMQVAASGSEAPRTGLDKPQYTVDLYVGDKDTKLTIGDTLEVTGGVYIQVAGHEKVDVVDSSFLDSLAKPANDFRKTQLFETASPSVQQIAVAHKDGSQLVLEKQAKGWQIIKPVAIPGDSSAAEYLVSSVINMSPVEFVDDPSTAIGFDKPTAVVTFSTVAPSTQPTTMPSEMVGGVKVIFGDYDGLQKKNVYVKLPAGNVVKVAATVLDSLNKKPFEMRDKIVIDFDPAMIQKMTIDMNQPATTQPTTQPAAAKLVIMQRRKKDLTLGPVLPTTTPTTAPAPVPQTDWQVMQKTPVDADDTKITTLLGQFHPLKADKYLESPSKVNPVKFYTISLSNGQPGLPAVLVLRDPGNDGALIGSYNDLWFEMPRTILTDLGAEFAKAPAK